MYLIDKSISEQNSECNNTQRGKYTQKTMKTRPCSRPESSTGIKTVSVICLLSFVICHKYIKYVLLNLKGHQN